MIVRVMQLPFMFLVDSGKVRLNVSEAAGYCILMQRHKTWKVVPPKVGIGFEMRDGQLARSGRVRLSRRPRREELRQSTFAGNVEVGLCALFSRLAHREGF